VSGSFLRPGGTASVPEARQKIAQHFSAGTGEPNAPLFSLLFSSRRDAKRKKKNRPPIPSPDKSPGLLSCRPSGTEEVVGVLARFPGLKSYPENTLPTIAAIIVGAGLRPARAEVFPNRSSVLAGGSETRPYEPIHHFYQSRVPLGAMSDWAIFFCPSGTKFLLLLACQIKPKRNRVVRVTYNPILKS
jgi:hypothetical protein